MVSGGELARGEPAKDVDSCTTPLALTYAIPPGARLSVNQTLPSGPAVIPDGLASAVNPRALPPVNSCTTPPRSMNPTEPGFVGSVNHRFPSGPVASPDGPRFAVNPGVSPPANSVTVEAP